MLLLPLNFFKQYFCWSSRKPLSGSLYAIAVGGICSRCPFNLINYSFIIYNKFLLACEFLSFWLDSLLICQCLIMRFIINYIEFYLNCSLNSKALLSFRWMTGKEKKCCFNVWLNLIHWVKPRFTVTRVLQLVYLGYNYLFPENRLEVIRLSSEDPFLEKVTDCEEVRTTKKILLRSLFL